MKTFLTIAGSDSSGGAGIQADIKTATALGMYAASVVTAVTAQNADMVYGFAETPADMVAMQLDAVFSQLAPCAVKIGMVPSAECAETVAQKLAYFGAKNIVIDPLAVASGGQRLASEQAAAASRRHLYPMAALLTPNLPEAALLAFGEGAAICGREEAERAAEAIFDRFGCAVLVKGGHAAENADDLLYDGKRLVWLAGERLPRGAHGTGCTLSSAIACRLAAGNTLQDAVCAAKAYLTGALRAAKPCGGSALLNFTWKCKTEE